MVPFQQQQIYIKTFIIYFNQLTKKIILNFEILISNELKILVPVSDYCW